MPPKTFAKRAALPAVQTAAFRRRVLRWFARHGRTNLPWQNARDAYAVWVAEIMLQQTRVGAVIPYYKKFMARFPNIESLAACAPDELLHHWSGLGYYARARNLHACAKKIMAEHGGAFPHALEKVTALPGIGRSTAGAILTFAFGKRHAVLDANVKRVLARHFAVGGGAREVDARLWQLAEQLLPRKQIGDYNQALMDLGAGICTMRAQCKLCPLQKSCAAHARGEQHLFPPRKTKRARPQKSSTMLLLQNEHAELLLLKRPPAGIWGGLWSLPEFAHADAHIYECARKNAHDKTPAARAPSDAALQNWCEQEFGLRIKPGRALPILRHSFTHFDLDIHPRAAAVTAAARAVTSVGVTGGARVTGGAQLWYNPAHPPRIGIPAAVARLLQLANDA